MSALENRRQRERTVYAAELLRAAEEIAWSMLALPEEEDCLTTMVGEICDEAEEALEGALL